jgi:hypothetical protein
LCVIEGKRSLLHRSSPSFFIEANECWLWQAGSNSQGCCDLPMGLGLRLFGIYAGLRQIATGQRCGGLAKIGQRALLAAIRSAHLTVALVDAIAPKGGLDTGHLGDGPC